jgi:hypothetical protein
MKCKVGRVTRSPVRISFYPPPREEEEEEEEEVEEEGEGGKEGGRKGTPERFEELWAQSREAALTHVSKEGGT